MPRPSVARWKWPSRPPLWPTKATPSLTPRSASRAYSMCSIMPSTLLVTPRQFGPTTASPAARAVAVTASCVGVIADLGEARGEHHGRADLAPRAGLDRLAHAGGRQREHGKVDAFGQFVRTLQHGAAVDRLVGAADQMNVTLEVVDLQALQNDLAGAARARRHADDRDRTRTQEFGDCFRTARILRSAHAASLSGWNIKQMRAVAERMPVRLHLHADLQLLGRAIDDVGDEVDADVERDAHHGVRLGAAKGRRAALGDGVGVHHALAGDLAPFDVAPPAGEDAHRTRKVLIFLRSPCSTG